MKKLIKKILNRIKGRPNIDKLVERGLRIGNNFHNASGVIIDPSHCWHITIGNNVTFAPRVHVLAHDTSTKFFLGYTKVANVVIGDNVFIGAGTIILPGVVVGNNVIVGAGSVVSKSVPDNSVACGNPARVIYSLEEYLEKEKNKMNVENVFSEEYTLRNTNFGFQEKNKLLSSCNKYKFIFVE